MPKKTNVLADLLDRAATHGIPAGEKPRPMADVAAACDIPRTYFYPLLAGENVPRPYTRRKISAGLAKLTGLTEQTVARRLDAYFDLL